MTKPILKLDWCSHEAAKYACEKWHYSGCIPKSKLAKIGIWEDGKFIGCIIFGVGATSDLVKQYGLKSEQGCELVRIALTKHDSQVSRIIAIALIILRKTFTGLRLVVSFADPTQGHHGGIYQASGWLFSGDSAASDEYIYCGKRWQGRSFRNSFKGMERHPDVTIVKGSSKHRYLMPLDEEMRKQVQSLAKPYPKRVRSADSGTSGLQPESDGANPIRTLDENNNDGNNPQ